MENSSNNSQPPNTTILEDIQNYMEEFNDFLKRHEVKEKITSFAKTSYQTVSLFFLKHIKNSNQISQKAEEYKVKEKSIEFAIKTKNFVTPYAHKAVEEAST